jgi:hypothetical protein
MDPLEHALDVATRMRQALQAELDKAREQRVLIRKLDVQGLFERARQRGEFNVKLADMQDALGAALAGAANVLGVDKVTLDVLHTSGSMAPAKWHRRSRNCEPRRRPCRKSIRSTKFLQNARWPACVATFRRCHRGPMSTTATAAYKTGVSPSRGRWPEPWISSASSMNAGAGLGVFRAQVATASHNIANANTPGYARQDAVATETVPAEEIGTNGYIGRGVSLQGVVQNRDQFIETQINTAYGNSCQHLGADPMRFRRSRRWIHKVRAASPMPLASSIRLARPESESRRYWGCAKPLSDSAQDVGQGLQSTATLSSAEAASTRMCTH